ncbi:MAG: tetratricopeptide repeat protein [Nitrospirae bacterium]|nr:tetratricopeptide repeat protein [Nitrospirota bacterium]
MPDLVKKITVGVAIFLVAFVALVSLKEKKTPPPQEQHSSPPVPYNLLNLDAKERELKALVEKDPQNRDLLFQLGALYFESNRFQQAIEVYKKILTLNDKDVDTLNELGLALHYTGRSPEAVEILRKATTFDPSHQRAWLSLGFVLASSGRTEEAKPALKKAADINPDNDVGKEAQRILGIIKKKG